MGRLQSVGRWLGEVVGGLDAVGTASARERTALSTPVEPGYNRLGPTRSSESIGPHVGENLPGH